MCKRLKNQLGVLLVILAILLSVSCRKEEFELVEAPKERNLEPNSEIANLLQRISMNDGSNDNIIDKASCFNIRLPITVIANGQEVNIESEEDYDLIEVIFTASDSDGDVLDIQFPITIIRNDFSEAQVNTQTELSILAEACNSGDTDDEDIECVDFIYPIIADVFNITTELTSRVTIASDKQLYGFIEGLDENLVVNVDFPVTLTFSNGTTNVINDLVVLESFILDAKDDCDEDDDFEEEEDEEEEPTSISAQDFSDLLTSCKWGIEEMEVDGQNLITTYEPYIFIFNLDGTMTAETSGSNSSGTWSITMPSDGLILQISIDSLTDLNQEWQLQEINMEDDGTRLVITKLEGQIKFKQNCM